MSWQTPKQNWVAGDIPTAGDFNRIEGNIYYIEEESRTPSDSATPAASGKLSLLLSYIVSMLKAITGKSNWYTAPATTLEAAKSHIDAASPHSGHATTSALSSHTSDTAAHSATSAATASRIMMRDASGRAKVAAPNTGDDIAIKSNVDTVQSNLNTHKTSNDHDDRYYTETEIDVKINDIGILTQMGVMF
jgi:hypothetical protein